MHFSHSFKKAPPPLFQILATRLTIWPKGYQRGSVRKSHQNGDYLKQAMRKSYPLTAFEPAAIGSSLAEVLEQCTGNPKSAGSNLVGRQLFRIACFK